MFVLVFGFWLVLMLFIVGFVVDNYLVWWSLFVVMDLIFVFLCKEECSYSSIVNYFIYQECLGLFFLFVGSSLLQGVIVMCKMGLLPFHFWLLTVVDGLSFWVLAWFLTWQKLPYMGVLIVLLSIVFVYIVVVGFFVAFFQLFVSKDYYLVLVLNSTESFGWILLGVVAGVFSGVILFLYYFLAGLLLLPFSGGSYDVNFGWLTTLIYINIPLGVSFFVKLFVLGVVVNFFFVWFICIMIMMFMSFMAVFSWFMSMSLEYGLEESKVNNFLFLIVGCVFLLLIYYMCIVLL